jgi:hypothetical protein
MRLPNARFATLDIRKLADYCLSPTHPRGRHKARVFRAALGIEQADAAWLREVLLVGVTTAEALEMSQDAHGTTWRADLQVVRPGSAPGGNAVVRTLWIVPPGLGVPRFVTCWVM